MMNSTLKILLVLFSWFIMDGVASPSEQKEIRDWVEAFKKDDRGPYQSIRWFCPDGTVIPANLRCTQPGGIQHALHKDEVQRLATEKQIYLGQILAGTPVGAFFDAANSNSRLKQYQMEKYLQAADNGWIFRKARFYRGAIQAEDEEAWGLSFLNWLLAKDEIVKSQFFLIRQAGKDIPHQAEDQSLTLIRSLSKTIADSLPAFMNIRIKIHGQPDASDLQSVQDFRRRSQQRISPGIAKMLQSLESELELAYRPNNLQSLSKFAGKLPANSEVMNALRKVLEPGRNSDVNAAYVRKKCREISDLLWSVRRTLNQLPPIDQRLTLLDFSIELESILFRLITSWRPQTIGELFERNYVLAKAAAGCGFLEVWEWQAIETYISPPAANELLTFSKFSERASYARRIVDWSTAMLTSVYGPVIAVFNTFEPLAAGFIDEQVRSSILLPLGETAGNIKDIIAASVGGSNYIMAIKGANQMHGLNPGLAKGELVVVRDAVETITFSPSKIYMLPYAPADLNPVAGIATVSESNLVSHVQLLARNLGIPNASLSDQNLKDLAPFSGQEVFYAVSPRGAVLMKAVGQMTAQERAMFQERKRPTEKIRVPTDRIDLTEVGLIGLRKIRATDSGRFCGPKAANLGQLKSLFPFHVVEGFVIPFGVFRRHLQQPMPQTQGTYWQFLQDTFEPKLNQNKNDEQLEAYILARLTILREAIQSIPLLPEFREELQRKFPETFGEKLGQVPVFIRSDTNMEDLQDFTGAGLNLTVFNAVEEASILKAIRDVWASPYTERGYRWRQKYLLNPENVFPSILILPTVNVQKSGVMITSGVTTSNPEDVTVAFNRGAGGAVEGQKAESYLVTADGKSFLLSPSREQKFTTMPRTGGTTKETGYFHEPILTRNDLLKLREMAGEIRAKLPGTPGIQGNGPFDVELGFIRDRVILFQVRPFVENKRAQASLYLRSLDASLPKNLQINLDEKLK